LFADSLDQKTLKRSSKHRMLSAVKSLFAFGHRIGCLQFDVAKPLRLPSLRDALSERILSEAQVQRMLALERQPRNHALSTSYIQAVCTYRNAAACGGETCKSGRTAGKSPSLARAARRTPF
jgi:site-specific recombinase XerD